MKKFILIVLILPFISWAQEDSLNLKNQTIDEILKNRIPNGAVMEHSIPEVTKIDSIYIPNTFKGTVPSHTRKIKEPQYVLNGELISIEQARKIDPNKIESIEIIKNGEEIYSHQNLNGTVVIKTKDSSYELVQYDLAVLDLGYESFLKMQPSAGTFSLRYLQNRNQRYVSLWNQRTLTNPEIYEMPIDYDSQTFYGLEFEHKLYMFFKLMEKKHSISML